MMNLLSLLLSLLLTVPVYSQTGPNTLSDSSDIVKTKDGYVLGKKSDIGKKLLKDKSELTVLGFDVDSTSFIDCLVTKIESVDKVTFFNVEAFRYMMEECLWGNTKIDKRNFGKTMLKGFSKLKGSGFDIDTNNFVECFATKFESLKSGSLFKDTLRYITEACIFSSIRINKRDIGKTMLKGLSNLEGSGLEIDTNNYIECILTKFKSSDNVSLLKEDPNNLVKACLSSSMKINKSEFLKFVLKELSSSKYLGFDIDTIKYVECFTNKYESLDKVTLFTRDTFKYITNVCLYSSLKINKSDILKVVLKDFNNSKIPGFDIDTTNCIECLETNFESLDKDAPFKMDTVSYIVKACISRSIKIKDSIAINIALSEFCKDSLTKIRSDLKKLSIEGEESLATYCDCFAKNLLKIEKSKLREVINEWKSLSGEYNNGVVFPCIQLAQNKARQKNDMYNPNDIIGSVDSSTIELLRIGDSKMVQVTIGDITKYYVLDTGADLLIIDDKSEHELISNKKLLPSMFIGEKQLRLADNRQVNAKIYKINNVRIGDYIVRNIEIGVIENGFLLCGMSLLKKFKDWKIESELNVLKLFK